MLRRSFNEDTKNHLKKLLNNQPSNYKGQNGKIMVIGGCLEYSGAPYFSAISSLRAGAELAFVLCTKKASNSIKSYSPDLIVLPYLNEYNDSFMNKWLEKSDVCIFGPGLGKDENVVNVAQRYLEAFIKLKKPLIIDADGLAILENISFKLNDFDNIIITPNLIELSRISQISIKKLYDENEMIACLQLLHVKYPKVTILAKSKHDYIMNGGEIVINETLTSKKRCGGQGDILCGLLASFLNLSIKNNIKKLDSIVVILK